VPELFSEKRGGKGVSLTKEKGEKGGLFGNSFHYVLPSIAWGEAKEKKGERPANFANLGMVCF